LVGDVRMGSFSDSDRAAAGDGTRYQHNRGEKRLDHVREQALSTPLESCSTFTAEELASDDYLTEYNLRQNDSCITSFSPGAGHDPGETHKLYEKYARGYFRTKQHKVVTQVFEPSYGKRSASEIVTVLVLHGYNDHVGVLQDTIKHLLVRRRRVVTFDLPGHGLSSGKQNVIHDFGEYADAVARVKLAIRPVLTRMGVQEDETVPWDCVAHSTGASALVEHMHRMTLSSNTKADGDAGREGDKSVLYDDGFGRVAMFAPLVRFVKWRLSKVGRLFHSCIPGDFVTARPPERRVDARFLRWEQFDALQSPRVELEWVRAVYSWERRVRTYTSIPRPVFIVQGTLDNTVLWRHNIPVFRDRLFTDPAARIEIIQGATHQFLNTSDDLQRRLFALIDDYLQLE